MEGEKSVKLHGMWASPYVLSVILSLKIKGIEFEYIEENLFNKSELLLKYNPVHKKVPILVHNGLPISESTIILEYIDETWTDPPHLLPKDPYLRAKYRFWAAYLQHVSEMLGKTLTEGEATDEFLNEYSQKMDIAEEFIKADEMFPNENHPSFQDVKPGYFDIMLYCFFFGASEIVEEFFGFKLLTVEKYPFLVSWSKSLSEVPEVKDVTPPKAKLVELFNVIRQRQLQSKA